eukprot:COSAG03_NODE_5017_length_1362_cov_84.801267_2_plen_24_part_01
MVALYHAPLYYYYYYYYHHFSVFC